MAQYNMNMNGYSNELVQNKLLTRTYTWMFLGLMITAATSFFLYATGIFWNVLLRMPALSLILAVAQIALVIAFTGMAKNASPSAMRGIFIAYSITLGISMTSLAYVYSFGDIAIAFVVTAVYFGCLSIIGFTTKRDMSKIGTICIAGLVALLITQLIMILFRVSMDTRLISIIGLLLFTGITAWDVQRLHQVSRLNFDDPAVREKFALYFALELYLDFINIFLYILRLLGNSRSSN